MRLSRGWTQEAVAKLSGMAQPRIHEIEKPGARRLNLNTLLRLASAFDVALDISFVPFGDFIGTKESFDPDSYSVMPFTKELELAERHASNSESDDGRRFTEILLALVKPQAGQIPLPMSAELGVPNATGALKLVASNPQPGNTTSGYHPTAPEDKSLPIGNGYHAAVATGAQEQLQEVAS
jgi:transcriptional regulator with XRE-family HTH domain